MDDVVTSFRSRSTPDPVVVETTAGDVSSPFVGSTLLGSANLALMRRVRSSTVGNRALLPTASTRSDVTILPLATSCSLVLMRIVSPDFT